MSSNFEHAHEENEDYGKRFRPDREIYVVKKDGSKELFNVQKVISAVGKSAYRALTKFTKEYLRFWSKRQGRYRRKTSRPERGGAEAA